MGNLRGAIILIGIACPVVKTVNNRFKIAVLLGILALALGLVAAGNFVSPRLANEVALPCITPEWVKEHVNEVLGDCLDTGGILFRGSGRGPGVEPLGDPIDGGILFSGPLTIKFLA